jgi:hypothetical protein
VTKPSLQEPFVAHSRRREQAPRGVRSTLPPSQGRGAAACPSARHPSGAEPDCVWGEVYAGLTRLLASHKLAYVTVERAQGAPAQSFEGKYCQVIPLG